MQARTNRAAKKPRELRRRVMVSARLRDGMAWSDARILNLSSRGLMIHTARPLGRGSEVAIQRGDHVIIAEVVWRDGAHAGLRASARVPVDEILSLALNPSLHVGAARVERRKRPRTEDQSRMRGRSMEFAATLAIVASLSALVGAMIEKALAAPLSIISAHLGG